MKVNDAARFAAGIVTLEECEIFYADSLHVVCLGGIFIYNAAMIYRAKYIVPMDGRIIENGEVLVGDGVIVDIGADLGRLGVGASVCDLGNRILMPGFVNAHSHIEYTINRNRYDALNLWDWINRAGYRRGQIPDTEILAESAFLGAAECALSGITCLGDSSFSGLAADAMDRVGLRGVVYKEIFGQSMGSEYKELFAAAVDEIVGMREQVSGRVKIGLSPHSIYTSNREVLKLTADTITNMGISAAIHLAETDAEAEYTLYGSGPIARWRRELGYPPMVSGMTPGGYLADVGLLRPEVALAHCVALDDKEIDMIAESGAGVVHCPRSNALLGAGIAPIGKMMNAGARIALGTDGAASCSTYDFFSEMRAALMLQRSAAKDAGVITAKKVLEMATIGGAEVLGLSDITGTLQVGKRADMIAIDVGGMRATEDIYLVVVNSSPDKVKLVVVDGKEIARDGLIVS